MKEQQMTFDLFSGELKTKEQLEKEEKSRKEAAEKAERELNNARNGLKNKIATALRNFDPEGYQKAINAVNDEEDSEWEDDDDEE